MMRYVTFIYDKNLSNYVYKLFVSLKRGLKIFKDRGQLRGNRIKPGQCDRVQNINPVSCDQLCFHVIIILQKFRNIKYDVIVGIHRK